MRRGKIKDYVGKSKSTQAKKENERLRVKIKGAGSAKGGNKVHEERNKMLKGEMKDNGVRGEGRRAKEGNKRCT